MKAIATQPIHEAQQAEQAADNEHPVAEPPEETQEERDLSAADVIDAGQWYSFEEIKSLVGIGQDALQHAITMQQIPKCQQTMGSTTVRVLGADVLAWIASRKIAHQISSPEESELGIGPADVLQSRWYLPIHVEELLGISVARIHQAVQAKGFHQQTGDGRLYGPDIVRWVAREGIPYEVSDGARAVYRRTHPEPDPPPDPGPKTVLEQAEEIEQRWQQGEGAERERWQDETWALYAAILQRSEEPLEQDGQSLAHIMRDLNLTGEQVTADREVVAKARKLQQRHASRGDRATESREARKTYHEMVESQKREEQQNWRAMRTGEGREQEANQAGYQLSQLAKERPRLFDTSTTPPQLRTAD